MLAVSIELLTGRYVATAYNDRDCAEWPPHPGRLFSALVAVLADSELDDPQHPGELAALHWLEAQEPPEILASDIEHTGVRTVVPVYVPVNDVSVIRLPSRKGLEQAELKLAAALDDPSRDRALKNLGKAHAKLVAATAAAMQVPSSFPEASLKSAAAMLPESRGRQPRTFPCAIPENATVAFVWPQAEATADVLQSLGQLLARLVRLGHSSSLVHGSILGAGGVAALASEVTVCVPDEDGLVSIRWVAPGQVTRLARAYELHQETEPRVLPARFCAYRWGRHALAAQVVRTVFDPEIIVLARVAGPRLPSTSAVGLASQVRRAILSAADDPLHEILSGHRPDGAASELPHLAVVPLPYVFGQYADGCLLGVGLCLPRASDPAGRRAVMRALGKLEVAGDAVDQTQASVIHIHLGSAGQLSLQRVVWGEDRRKTLQSRTWNRPARYWATATPIALDRNPGDLHDRDAEKRSAAFAKAAESVAQACERIGLPRPVEVDVVRSCVMPGTAKPSTYPRYPIAATRPQRVLVHARLVFHEPVSGPVLLGAGRYYGLGLCAPIDQ